MHCVDSATNSLAALEMLAIPDKNMQSLGVKYIDLLMHGFCYFAPILRQEHSSIAYPCWDNSSRTAIRNLLNGNISITAENYSHESGITTAKIASVLDLKQLKAIHLGTSIRQGDFSDLICQNCDATGRVLNQKVVDELSKYVPGSEGTQMYFGTPLEITRRLWAGLMTFKRWRQGIMIVTFT